MATNQGFLVKDITNRFRSAPQLRYDLIPNLALNRLIKVDDNKDVNKDVNQTESLGDGKAVTEKGTEFIPESDSETELSYEEEGIIYTFSVSPRVIEKKTVEIMTQTEQNIDCETALEGKSKKVSAKGRKSCCCLM